jgi:membrane protein
MFSVRIIYRACLQWSANGDSRLGAALAYYTLFSIAPLLVIAITIAGSVYGESAARGKVKLYLKDYIPEESAAAVENLVDSASKSPATSWEQALSVGILIYGAIGAFVHLRTSLCLIWKLDPPHSNTILATLFDYGLSLLMVLFTGVLLLISLATSITVSAIRRDLEERFPGELFPWNWVEYGLSVVFLGVLFGSIFRILSGRRIDWGYVSYGAIVSALLFTAGKILLSIYFVYAGTATTYGAAGSLVVFLVWVYYSSQTLFFGAELIQARRTRHEWLNSGSATDPRPA